MNETNDKIFWDSNLWLYLFLDGTTSDDIAKKAILLDLLEREDNLIGSAQVLNEVANVLLRKYNYSEADTREALEVIDEVCTLIPLTKALSIDALAIKAQYHTSWFDSLIIAAALKSNCKILYTEDLHHSLIVNGTLTIINPFK